MQNFMEYISQLCYIVTNNPKPQWLKATKFSFLLTLEPGRRPGSACSVSQADEEAPVLGVPPSWKKEQNKWAGGNLHWQGFCSDVAPVTSCSHATDQWKHLSQPHINGARLCTPLTGGAASHMATGAENEQRHTATEWTACLTTAALQAKLACKRIFQNPLPFALLY